ncbi:hypothetical protein J3B02_005105, partial [Coemansia erecta]
INAASLRKLVLDDIPSEFSWQCFEQQMPKDTFKLIRFSNLQVLELYFAGQLEDTGGEQQLSRTDTAENQYQMEFPKLHSLSITNYPPNAAMSLAAKYPSHLKQLTLRYSFIPPNVFVRSDIRSVDSLDVTLYYAQLEHPDNFYALTNHLFGRVKVSKNHSSLLMSYSEFQLDHSRIQWSNLSVIRIMSQVDYLIMEQMVRMMPQLEKLVIYELTFTQQSMPISNESCNNQQTMVYDAPWETSIRYLEILSLAYISKPEVITLCIKRFLEHLPLLCSLHINGYEAVGMNDFSNLFKPQHRHMLLQTASAVADNHDGNG